uniref:Uncharacterized protein n=1 Tax=viral metagenome TaxID=1070528 RepID=A0A6C0IRR4_9ZZZZ
MSSFEPESKAPLNRPETAKPSTQPQNASTPNASAISNIRLPSDLTSQHASKLAIVEDKPIMLDYWVSSLEKKALIGVRENGEKLLVKSAEEYTSPISKFYKSATEYIIITENSIYIVSSDIQTRKIT